MQIQFQNTKQVMLANLLWECPTQEEVNQVIKTYGVEAQIVFNMIIAAAIDDDTKEQTEFPNVMEILDELK